MDNIDNLFNNFPSEKELLNIIKYTSTTSLGSEFAEKDIKSWLENFKGEVIDVKYERLLALWLLSHFTYYNKEEVNHLCKVLYSDLIHLIVRSIDTTQQTIEDTVNSFFSKSNIISAEETSGSGGFIAYIFRQVNNLPIKDLFNFSLENISDDIQNIIVIDDVTLSVGDAGQKYKFWQKAHKLYPNKNFYLLTLIANEDSIKDLYDTFKINVVSSIKLDNRDRCFNGESDIFSSFPELIGIAKKVAEHYGRKIDIRDSWGETNSLGYSDGQYAFGFYYNTPDNSLPIFWGQKNGWLPILKRYHKNYYKTEKYLHDERFI
jgi:hypothetical protein